MTRALTDPNKIFTAVLANWPTAITARQITHITGIDRGQVTRWLDQMEMDGIIDARVSMVMVAPGAWARYRYYTPAELAAEFALMMGAL
jgi:hypothetical protein